MKTFIQLLAHLRCTVPTPGWEKRRVLLSDLKSRQPTTWEADHQTTFHLQILVPSLSKICKAAGWMLTAMSAQSGGLIRIPDQQHWNIFFSRYRDPQPEDLVMYLHALRYTVSTKCKLQMETNLNKFSSRAILGHSKPPSPPGQNQAGLDENCSLCRRLKVYPNVSCHVVLKSLRAHIL